MAAITVADALERILSSATPLPAEEAPLEEADGRVLAHGLKALRTQPPAALSAMDGYAVRASDVAKVPAQLTVIGEIAAGRPFDGVLGPGQALRIFTGAVVPQGADTIVIQENTTRVADQVTVQTPAPPGRNIRPAGLDFRAGEELFAPGHRLTARDLALAAGMNHPLVPLHRRPSVAIFATGDELVRPGVEPGPGQIVYSNGFTLSALTMREGAFVTDLGVVPDTIEAAVEAVREAGDIEADVLVTTGGASVGDYDLVQKAFVQEGMALAFWKIAMRPGRPLMYGKLRDMHVLGLPGNPVSSYVCAVLFLIPLLRRLGGRTDLTPPTESAVLGRDLPANDEREDYLRAKLSAGSDGPVATAFATQDSSMMATLSRADCLIIREPHAPAAKAGAPCRIVKLER
jgi:molybdopterin molybdotransferase